MCIAEFKSLGSKINMSEYVLKYYIGQVVEHNKFGYRGVIYDADAQFEGSEDWYETVAKSRPPKDAPWYHVLVDGQEATTYVAERHLQASNNVDPIQHYLLDLYFSSYKNNKYIPASTQ